MTTTEKSTRKWLNELVLELRIQNITGAAIGDTVAEVEAHLAETAEAPREAFGTPREYAATLNLPTDTSGRLTPQWWIKLATGLTLGFLGGLWLVPSGVAALKRDEGAVFPVGMVITLAVMVVVIGVTALTLDRFLRPGPYGLTLWFVAVAALVVSVTIFDGPLFTLNAWLAVAAGAVAVLIAVPLFPVFGAETEITDPRGQRSRYAVGRAASAGSWIWPVFALVAGTVAWFTA